MNNETWVVVVIVGGALAFIGRRVWQSVQRARRPAQAPTSGAGCEGCGPAAGPAEWDAPRRS